ncbi:MAG: GNAT family N-acetyltransferase [Rhodospirillales bacterium]|nr:GNAT family N-acetyltransferase [Rhodospirillales bacterium]
MTPPPFRIARLAKHDRSGFRCGSEALDRYFRTQASQDIRKRVTSCHVALDAATHQVAGFYTLSAADIPLTELPSELAGKVPRYPTLPVARVGRLAVDERYRGRKIGSVLLFDAVQRAAGSEVAVFAVVVDAKDATAEAFYRHHGFTAYGSAPGLLIAPIKQLLGS